MDWDNVRFFLAVAREGTLSHAATKLGVTHVTVSRRIDRLEEQLEEIIFNRLQSGYTLTPAGEDLLPEAEAIESAFLSFQQQALSQPSSAEGELRLSLPEPSAIDLSTALSGFLTHHPRITLRVSSTMDTLDINQLEAEVVLRITDSPPEMLVGRELTRLPFGPYASRAYVESHGRSLENADWIIWDNTDIKAEHYLKHFAGIKKANILMRSDTNIQMLEVLKAGSGVGIVTQPVADRCHELVPMSDKPWGDIGLWILTHRSLRHSKRIKLFMQYIVDYFGTPKSLL